MWILLCPDTCGFEDNGLCDFTQINYETAHWERKKAGDIIDGTTLPTFIDKTYGTKEGMFFIKG